MWIELALFHYILFISVILLNDDIITSLLMYDAIKSDGQTDKSIPITAKWQIKSQKDDIRSGCSKMKIYSLIMFLFNL